MKNLTIVLVPAENINHTRDENGNYVFFGVEGRFLQVILDAFGVENLNAIDVKLATEVIDAVHRGEADLALTGMIQHYTLLDKIDFSWPYFMLSYSFGIRKSIPIETKFAFLYPFTLQVWISCIAVGIVLPLCYKFLVNTKLSYIELLCCFWIGITKQRAEFMKLRSRILIASSLVFRVIVSFCYAAVLLSFMANPLMNPPIRNFKELSAAVKSSGMKVYCWDTMHTRGVLRDAEQPYLRFLYEYLEKHNYYYWDDNVDYAKLFAEGTAFIMRSPSSLEIESVAKYSAYISDDKITHMMSAVYLNKQFCCKKRLNTILGRLWQAGIFHFIMHDEAVRQGIEQQKSDKDAVKAISMENLFGVFMLLLLGYIVASFALVCEIFVHRKQSDSKSNKRK